VFKPGAELRGVSAQVVDAETASFSPVGRVRMSSAVDAALACPATDVAVLADPAGRGGRQPVAVADVLSATVPDSHRTRRGEPVVARASKLKQREG